RTPPANLIARRSPARGCNVLLITAVHPCRNVRRFPIVPAAVAPLAGTISSGAADRRAAVSHSILPRLSRLQVTLYLDDRTQRRTRPRLATMDPEVERHYRGWLGFVRFMKIAITLVVITLVLMAIFLL